MFVKNNQQQLFNTAAILSSDISWDKQEIGQKLKKYLINELSIEGFEKPHICFEDLPINANV